MYKRWILIFLLLFSTGTGCLTIKQQKETVSLADKENDIHSNIKKLFKQWKNKLYANDPNIQTAAAVSLLGLGYPNALTLLIDILKEAKGIEAADIMEGKGEICISVLKAFGFIGDDSAMDEIIALLDSENERIRTTATETLGNLKTLKAQKIMTYELLNPQRSLTSRVLIADALGNVRDRDSVQPLINLLESTESDLQTAAHNALMKITKQSIGKEVGQWKEWWDLNKGKSREEWLEDIVEKLEDDIKQLEAENGSLNKEIAQKSISLLELTSDNVNMKPFLEAIKSNYPEVKIFAVDKLSKIKTPEVLDIFLELLLDKKPEVRIIVARALGEMGDKKAVPALLGIINDKDVNVQIEVVKALGRLAAPEAVDAVIPLLDAKDINIVKASIETLGQIGDQKAAGYLMQFLLNNDPSIRESTAVALGKIKDPRSVVHLISALSDKEEKVRWYAADSLGKLKTGEAVEPLIKLLSDTSARVRESAATSLGQIGSEKAVEYLIKMLDDPDQRVKEQAAEALLLIAGEKLDNLNNLSNIFFIKKDYNRTIKALEKQLDKYNENEEAVWQARLRLAKSYISTGNWDKSINLYLKLVEHFPDDIELKKELLHALTELKHYDRSLELLSNWMKASVNNKDFFWKQRLELISAFFGNGEYKKVRELVDKFEAENPELGGRELKSDFISLREKSIMKEKGLN